MRWKVPRVQTVTTRAVKRRRVKPQVCRQFIVTGRVQGVFFRDSTRRAAKELQLNGSAINLPDGSVQVRVCGSQEEVLKLRQWLHEGSPLSRVDTVLESALPCCAPTLFEIA